MYPQFLLRYILLLAPISQAHLDGDLRKELENRRRFLQDSAPSLLHCREQLKRDARVDTERFQKRALALRSQRDLEVRELDDFPKDHGHDHDFDLDDDTHDIFDKYPACALSPDTTEGPFYIKGELVRSDLTDNQRGIPLHLDIRVKDFDTCEDVKDVYVEIWRIYGGTNGRPKDETFGRGLQKTDEMGVVEFDTIVPGHYAGRAQHIHVGVHVPSTKPDPDSPSVSNNVVSLCAQLFFDQGLADRTRKIAPYSENKQPFTANADDIFLKQEAAGRFDPFVSWVYLGDGDDLADGLLAWVTVGANMTEHRALSVAASREE
ncbi:hypothetical protein SLS62_008110 [Diatrype stigma]|uniref:Intradiol ring-cleavage dioxygenases domain-containing protein n=1 Tax=Diatrype stigma TaxID=117547 RepID=A0AAN9UN98_9PEZI